MPFRVLAGLIVAGAASACTTVLPTAPTTPPVPLSRDGAHALGVASIAALGPTGVGPATLASAGGMALTSGARIDVAPGMSVDGAASFGLYGSTYAFGRSIIASGDGRLWFGPDDALPLGVEFATVLLYPLDGHALGPSGFLELRGLAAQRLPGPARFFVYTRPGFYAVPIFAPALAGISAPVGVAFNVGPICVSAEGGVDFVPSGNLVGGRFAASAVWTL